MVDSPSAISYYSAPPILPTRLEDCNETVGPNSLWVCRTSEKRGRDRLRLSGGFRATQRRKNFRASGHKRGLHHRSPRVYGNPIFARRCGIGERQPQALEFQRPVGHPREEQGCNRLATKKWRRGERENRRASSLFLTGRI